MKQNLWVVLSAVLLLGLGSASARAGDNLGQAWLPIVQDLVYRKHITSVGDLDLTRLLAVADPKAPVRVTWLPMTGPPPTIVAGSRQSAYFDCRTHTIHRALNIPAEDLQSLPHLELHEFMSAAPVFENGCVNDKTGSPSTALIILDKTENPVQLRYLRQLYGQTIFRRERLLATNGGSSVGGGGDLPTLAIKDQVRERIMAANSDNQALMTSDFLRLFPNVDFEPIAKADEMRVVLHYRYERRGDSYAEGFEIDVPMTRWTNASLREGLVQEIAAKILALFPTDDGAATPFTPKECPSSVVVRYPPPSDSHVAGIQYDRALLTNRCDWRTMLDSEEIITPYIGQAAMPIVPGRFDFKCSFSYFVNGVSGYLFEQELHLPITGSAQGIATHITSYGIQIPSGVYFFNGEIAVNGLGSIVGARLFAESNPQTPFQRVAQPSQSQLTLDFQGGTIHFDCLRTNANP